MARFACLNKKCRVNGKKFLFEGEAKCPKCGVSIHDPYYGAQTIVPMATIHYHLPSPVAGIGSTRRACDGKSALPTKEGLGHASTGNTNFVNCPGCKKHPVFLENSKDFPAFSPDQRTNDFAQKLETQRKGGK